MGEIYIRVYEGLPPNDYMRLRAAERAGVALPYTSGLEFGETHEGNHQPTLHALTSQRIDDLNALAAYVARDRFSGDWAITVWDHEGERFDVRSTPDMLNRALPNSA